MINSNGSNIKTYVGSDGKIHFKDWTGADTVLNFNSGFSGKLFSTTFIYTNAQISIPITLDATPNIIIIMVTSNGGEDSCAEYIYNGFLGYTVVKKAPYSSKTQRVLYASVSSVFPSITKSSITFAANQVFATGLLNLTYHLICGCL